MKVALGVGFCLTCLRAVKSIFGQSVQFVCALVCSGAIPQRISFQK